MLPPRQGWRLTPRLALGIVAGILLLIDLYLIFGVAPHRR